MSKNLSQKLDQNYVQKIRRNITRECLRPFNQRLEKLKLSKNFINIFISYCEITHLFNYLISKGIQLDVFGL